MRIPNVVAFGFVAIAIAGCGDDPSTSPPTPDTSGPIDVAPDDASAADAVVADSGVEDAVAEDASDASDTGPIQPDAVDCTSDPGAGYCACTSDTECASGTCLQTSYGKRCGAPCEAGCPEGWECLDVGTPGAGASKLCVQRTLTLCMPCRKDSECAVEGFQGDKCANYGEAGSFCATPCDAGSACVAGFECVGGVCLLEAGTCECAPHHKLVQASTDCVGSNEYGGCNGTRECAPEGLTKCSSPTAAPEVCDGKDNNCDGATDDVAAGPCQEENAFGTCLGTKTCTGGGWSCDAQTPAEETCNGKDDDCNGTTDDGFDDLDEDGQADCADLDKDGDEVPNDEDNCPLIANPGQDDFDLDEKGDACDPDDDNDLTPDSVDCEPKNKLVFPFAAETCDGLDNNCNGAVDEKSCDDGNGCTNDSCDPIEGCQNELNTKACTDGNPCTKGDVCDGGSCVGQFVSCNDQNPCTDDECDPAGGCKSTPNTLQCSDGNPCTDSDKCSGGVCIPGSFLKCDDGNACTVDSCDPESGCQVIFNQNPCDDGSPCTVNDVCQVGACVGAEKACDDGNPCTTDGCDPTVLGGCVTAPASGATCDDGLDCTEDDVCKTGECTGKDVGCDCEADADCAASDDGNLCNGTLFCDKTSAPFKCKVKPGTTVSCEVPAGMDAACTAVSCDPQTGSCSAVAANEGGSCNDGQPCSDADACKSGLCKGVAATCDDANACTTDLCDPALGCVFEVVTGFKACDDANACTTNDACQAGFCSGKTPVVCNDQSPCTDDLCDPKSGCTTSPNQNPCNDQTACTINDVCSGGSCGGSPLACDDGDACNGKETCDAALGCAGGADLTCNDGIACTKDSCLPAAGCKYTADPSACDDGVFCNGAEVCDTGVGCTAAPQADGTPCDDATACTDKDACIGGVCKGAPKTCDDDNVCTIDLCDKSLGCTAEPVTGFKTCDDGDACSKNDVCKSGFCQGQATIECNDNNICTTDSCDLATGCSYVQNTKACDDADPCTEKDACLGGACAGAAIACDDGNQCNGLETCQAGAGCTGGAALVCDDGVPCTVDTCAPAAGCKHFADNSLCDDGKVCNGLETCDLAKGCGATPAADGTACSDNNPCTTSDACSGGACLGTNATCDDLNPCTVDACDPAQGCVSVPSTGFKACDDSNKCTADDQCKDGFCKGTPTVVCDDANPCTDDSCTASGGCVYTANTIGCDDGSACTTGDVCLQSVCKGKSKDCTGLDGECTTGTCQAATGQCVAAPKTATCNDQDACTVDDACNAGQCKGAPMDCSDFDGTCLKGVCELGTCKSKAVSCVPKKARVSFPTVGYFTGVTGTHNVRGSAGQASPVGKAANATGKRVRWGFFAGQK